VKNRNINNLNTGDLVNQAELGLMSGKLSRRKFLNIVAALGVSSTAAYLMANHGIAVAANQKELKKTSRKNMIILSAAAAPPDQSSHGD